MDECRFTDHARREMETEPFGPIRVDDVLQALDSGEIIEEYAEDRPYPSCLVLGRTVVGRPIRVACAPPVRGRSNYFPVKVVMARCDSSASFVSKKMWP